MAGEKIPRQEYRVILHAQPPHSLQQGRQGGSYPPGKPVLGRVHRHRQHPQKGCQRERAAETHAAGSQHYSRPRAGQGHLLVQLLYQRHDIRGHRLSEQKGHTGQLHHLPQRKGPRVGKGVPLEFRQAAGLARKVVGETATVCLWR